MTLLDLVILLIVAGICGALGQAIAGYSRGGCLVSIALGFVGAVLGVWLARALQLPEILPLQVGSANFPIVWSIIGSALFVAIIALLTRRRGLD
ncbi:MAG: GlsB/YeaQ/YmgE family stress response membrane protein [Pyrinomonadaceae bacterium]